MKNSVADRGKYAEGKIRDLLKELNEEHARFAWHRFVDTRAARGKLVQSAPSDFLVQTPGGTTYLEVKELEHSHLIAHDKIKQVPILKKFQLAGGRSVIMTYHRSIKAWRCFLADDIGTRSSGSWDLSQFPTFKTPREAFMSRFRLD